MVWGQHCRVDAAATLSIQNLWWSLWCAHLHAAKHYIGGATIQMFFCGTNLTNVSIQTFYCCSIASGVYCCPPRWKFLWMAAFLSQKPVTMIFPAASYLGMLDWTIPPITTWIQVLNVGPRFYPLWEAVTGGSHLQCQISAAVTICDTQQEQTLE
jgi:hypothetical protein